MYIQPMSNSYQRCENFADVGARVNERLPVLIAAVLAMSFVLLMLVFRSVLVPLKAVVLNVVSVAAAWGVLQIVWQNGHGSQAIWGIEPTGAIGYYMRDNRMPLDNFANTARIFSVTSSGLPCPKGAERTRRVAGRCDSRATPRIPLSTPT